MESTPILVISHDKNNHMLAICKPASIPVRNPLLPMSKPTSILLNVLSSPNGVFLHLRRKKQGVLSPSCRTKG